MAARNFGQLVRSRLFIEPPCFIPSISRSFNATSVSGEEDDNASGYESIVTGSFRSRLASCKRLAHSGYLSSTAPRRELVDYVGWWNSTGGQVFLRSLATKTKKSKSRSEETVEVDEDVVNVAKKSAIKMMEMALEVLSREHSKLRTGRASSGLLDHITVEAHGVRTPLNHIAAVSVVGLQTLSVLPYDPSLVKEVEKALLLSPLGLNPVLEGSILTVPLPRLTKEVCESMCKLAMKAGETAKLSIRRARKDALDRARAGGLSKDETKRFEKEVEESTKKYVKSVDDLCKKKEKEILA